MINKKDFTFVSACDGLTISACCMWPDKDIRGIVQIVHGMSEHKERYLDFMHFFVEEGYICVIHDNRGHGESVKTQEDMGYFYDTSGMYAVRDIYQLTGIIKKAVPDVPLILFGHSMGSLLVRSYCKRYEEAIDALIVCGPPSYNPAVKLGKGLVKLMLSVNGDHYRSTFLHHVTFGSFKKKFKETFSENVWLCSDEEVVKAYDEDALCGFIFTLNGFANIFALMLDVFDKKHWTSKKKQLPILFVAGEEDPCIGSVKKFNEAYIFMQKVGYTDIDHMLYKGKRHEILNETNKKEIYQAIFDWMKRKKL